MDDLARLIDTIDKLVAIASTTSDEAKKRESIEKALEAACLYFTKITKHIEDDITDVLDDTVIGARPKGLPLTDLIREHDELAPFRDFDALKKEFVPTLQELLRKQGRLSDERIHEIVEHIKRLHPQILSQETGVTQLASKFHMLKRLFCRSPDEPPPPPPPKDPDKTPPSSWSGEVREWANTLLEYLKYLGPAAGLFIGTQAPEKPPPQLPPSPPPIVQPWVLRLLGLLTMAALASYIDSRGHIPPESPPPSLRPRAGVKEQETVRELVGAH